jgi:hypothetical protein
MTPVRRFKPQAETLAGRAWQDLGWQPADHLDIERSGVILGAPIVPPCRRRDRALDRLSGDAEPGNDP